MMCFSHMLRVMAISFAAAIAIPAAPAAEPPISYVDGKLHYPSDENGNRVPDFSHCGFAGGDRDIPESIVRVIVTPAEGDDGPRIQAAIDYVASLPVGDDGLRGAVLLTPGEYQVAGDLRIESDGIALRGSGATSSGTTIIASGIDRRPLIRVGLLTPQPAELGPSVAIVDDYVPVGSTQLRIEAKHGFRVGDHVQITRPSTDEWISLLNMKVHGVGWRAGRCDVVWQRTITKVDLDTLQFDAPLTVAIDQQFGGGAIRKVTESPHISNIGVEDLQLRSDFDADNLRDEEHSWFAVVADNVQDAWIARTRCEHFAGGAIRLQSSARKVSVVDCLSLAPIAEIGGYRRHSFTTGGEQTLFLRCHAEHGYHDFVVEHCAAGPNAFVSCYAEHAHADSGPLQSWASGVLYDNVRIDGHELNLMNRWSQGPGVGWSAANCMAWQCQAAVIRAFNPPGAKDWVVGYWAEPVGDGEFAAESEFVSPTSLYQAQLLERCGAEAAQRVDPVLLDTAATTNPDVATAQQLAQEGRKAGRTLRDGIEERMTHSALRIEQREHPQAKRADTLPIAGSEVPAARSYSIVNGWLTCDGRVLTGGQLDPLWWRGSVRTREAAEMGPNITRFAPGYLGTGLTDDLRQVVADMVANHQAVYDHHYGLWYDRRRDDHLMVRRATGDVAPPYYEQPFARTGVGRAWDGLSQYDLTKFNPWYWQRLQTFAELAARDGIVLFHQHYFQHNILEAGAHWADSPWRPANNVNDTGLPEPPNYSGDKRIFMADAYYDTSNDKLRVLHEGYIRQAVTALGDRPNVIHSISAEYTGPEHFTRFWLEEVNQSRDDNSLVALACTRDVQDAILADSVAASGVDIVDIRYWCYAGNGELYAPPGGHNLAPRQFLRQSKLPAATPQSIARAVREYRLRYPNKVVTYFAGQYCNSPSDGWAVLLGGGSLADVPPLPDQLAVDITAMQPSESNDESLLQLSADDGSSLIYVVGDQSTLTCELPRSPRGYTLTWIDKESGTTTEGGSCAGGRIRLPLEERVVWIRARK